MNTPAREVARTSRVSGRFLCAGIGEIAAERCLLAGASDYIAKPVNMKDLMTLLVRHLRVAAPR